MTSGRRAENQLRAGLHRLAFDVGEDVVAAGDAQHVVEEAVPPLA